MQQVIFPKMLCSFVVFLLIWFFIYLNYVQAGKSKLHINGICLAYKHRIKIVLKVRCIVCELVVR